MPFSASDYQKVRDCKKNGPLRRQSKDRYAQYKKKDPFPEIGDALLNSVDIVKYCMTTGMIDPFSIENVKGVTYTCHFSGKYFYWDGKSDNLVRKTEADDPELILRPNSITYLEIEEMFQVPDYLIIRYNLQVNHVYKGLLLGTGPIVDPGFVGHLYIPLHNLTSNEYRVKKGAPLITLEFTKVGRNRDNNAWPETISESFDFTAIHHQPEEIPPSRDFDSYLNKALKGDERFRKTKNNVCVGSSIPEKIESAEESAQFAQVSAKNAEESAQKSEKSLISTKNFLFGIGVVGIITLLISIAALWMSIAGFISDVNGRIDSVLSSNRSISEENHCLQEENSQLAKDNEHIRKENTILQNRNLALQAIIDRVTSDQSVVLSEESSK